MATDYLHQLGLKLEQLDFGYVRECEDGRILEKMLKVLRSGREGCFPDLLLATEKRLIEVKPSSILLMLDQPPMRLCDMSGDERKDIINDLSSWSASITEEEEEMTKYETIQRLPPVRGTTSNSTTTMTKQELEDLAQDGLQCLASKDQLKASLLFQKVLCIDPGHKIALQGMAHIYQGQKIRQENSQNLQQESPPTLITYQALKQNQQSLPPEQEDEERVVQKQQENKEQVVKQQQEHQGNEEQVVKQQQGQQGNEKQVVKQLQKSERIHMSESLNRKKRIFIQEIS